MKYLCPSLVILSCLVLFGCESAPVTPTDNIQNPTPSTPGNLSVDVYGIWNDLGTKNMLTVYQNNDIYFRHNELNRIYGSSVYKYGTYKMWGKLSLITTNGEIRWDSVHITHYDSDEYVTDTLMIIDSDTASFSEFSMPSKDSLVIKDSGWYYLYHLTMKFGRVIR